MRAVWRLNGKKLATAKLESPVNLQHQMTRFWYVHPDSLASGEWQVDILLSNEKLDKEEADIIVPLHDPEFLMKTRIP